MLSKNYINLIMIQGKKQNKIVILTDFGKEIYELFEKGKRNEALKLVLNQAFNSNGYFHLFLDFIENEKGQQFAFSTKESLKKDYIKFCRKKEIEESPMNYDISFRVLFNTFIFSGIFDQRKFNKKKETLITLNYPKLWFYGLRKRPIEMSKWPLTVFIDALLEAYISNKKEKVWSFLKHENTTGVNYDKLREFTILRLKRADYALPSNPEIVFDGIFLELIQKNPNLIEKHLLLKNKTIIVIHAIDKEKFNLWG